MTGLERDRVGQKGEKGEELGVGEMTRDGALSSAPFSIFFGLPRRLSIRLLLSFVVSV